MPDPMMAGLACLRLIRAQYPNPIVSKILQILDTIEDYLNRNDIEGLRLYIQSTRVSLLASIKSASEARRIRLQRIVVPRVREGDYACYDVRDLYYAFSYSTLRRLGLG